MSDPEIPDPEEQPKRRRRRRSRGARDSEATHASEALEGAAPSDAAPAFEVPDASASAAEVAPEAELDQAFEADAPDEPEVLTEADAQEATEVVLEADDEAEGEAGDEPEAEVDEDDEEDFEDEEDEEDEEEEEEVPVSSVPAPARPAGRRRRGQWDPDSPPVVRAQAKYVRSSARKARLVCDHIRGKTVEEARAILAHTPRAVARDWSKLLESAVANAEHNHELVGEDLFVMAVRADEGPTIKRFQPRARGRATRIRKRTAHLTILLTPKE
jgi:ribosomal protein L22